MADVVSQAKRSEMMSGIRGADTKPEILIRSGLHRRGYRFRLHMKGLPGKPDLVLARYKAVVLVHGCFWHAHECHLFKWPSTRMDFWRKKILGNRERDVKVRTQLLEAGWRVLTVWECACKGKGRLEHAVLLDEIEKWLNSDCRHQDIAAKIADDENR